MKSEPFKIIPKLSLIGNDFPRCPYCDNTLPKMPGRKLSCPHCKQSILVRTRPFDNKKILIREIDLPILDNEYQIKKTADSVNLYHLNEAIQWIEDHGQTVNIETVYNAYIGLAKIALSKKLMMKYCGFLTVMGDIKRAERKERDSMLLYMDVLYLNANGAWDYYEELPKSLPFRKKERISIPVGLVGYINSIKKYLGLSDDEMLDAFLNESMRVKSSIGMEEYLSDGLTAWKIIQDEYLKYLAIQQKL